MQEIDVPDWEEFDRQIQQLRQQHPDPRTLLFRGLADAKWSLTTTLERHDNPGMLFKDYYRLICASESQIQTFIRAATWDKIETYPEIEALAFEYDKFDLHLWGGKLAAYGYMAFLRHHGFPSPLLDWTRSPYIAAFFAFQPLKTPPPDKVSVLAFCEQPQGIKMWSSGVPRIFRQGPYIRTHRRHYLQQGEYTLCLNWELDIGWRFVAHESVFSRNDPKQDFLWKFNIPWTERVKVLRSLDDHNVNAFSLFDSDEALLETIALRRLTLDRMPPL